jgi:hypothetical protein
MDEHPDPLLDDPDADDDEPELTDEDLDGRMEDAVPITEHTNLKDDDE